MTAVRKATIPILLTLSSVAGAAELPWAAPPLERAVVVLDGRTGERLAFDQMLDRLAEADVVFLGETHVDETTHRVELAVYEGLLERRQRRVVLALEMFDRDVQGVLDRYVAGEIDEPELLANARPWDQYASAYRPMVERARRDRLPVVASNMPRELVRKVASEGLGVLDELTPEQRTHAPAELFANSPAYWRRVDNAVRGHLAEMRSSGDDPERLTSTQSLWDNTMGESCARALDAHPGAMVLHVNGAFHSAYWDGTVRQLVRRRPDARVLTVDVTPARNPAVAELTGVPVADFVVVAEARASDRDQGAWSVALDRELDYRLLLPESATPQTPVPLLLWLGDDGLGAQDGVDLWRERLGDEVALAVVEPPYRARLDDLSEGGRWFWPDTFAEDLGALVAASERVWGYLLRHHPIDPARVVVAGEGTGATVVAAIALLGERMSHRSLAFEPSRYARLKDLPLPLPELRGEDPRTVALAVVGAETDEDWWRDELAAYREVGLAADYLPRADPARDREQERLLRDALGLDAPAVAGGPPTATLRVPADTPRAWHWARLFGLRYLAERGEVLALVDGSAAVAGEEVVPQIHPSTISDALPRCPGPFGGTTVVVVPAGLPEADRRAWVDLEQNDPVNAASRFHRLRVALAGDGGERALPAVLAALESAGRRNVLVVPAALAADPATMRALERETRPFADRLTLHWLPGLGGGKLPIPRADAEPLGVVAHELSVVLAPATHEVSVRDRIALPPGRRRAGAELTLGEMLTVRASEPPLRRLGPDPSADRPGVRYALEAASADGYLTIEYAGVIDFPLSDPKEEYARGFRQTRGRVGPEGVYLDGDTGWVARFGDEMVRFVVEVESPPDWHVISQGDGSSDVEPGEATRRRARWEAATPVEQVYLVGGPLTVARESAGAVEALVYLHQADEALARKYLDATARYLEMYRQLIGPYPYGKFALVENFWETGFGMPSFTLLGEQVIRLPFILHSSYPHEILHNWWGNSVFVGDGGNWCEGLTAYLADHLVAEQRGTGHEYRLRALQKYRDYVQEGRDFPLVEFTERHSAATEAVGYGKALMTFHMLRRAVGDDAFRAALASFYRKHKSSRASWSDLAASFAAETGEDLSWFFTQWTERPGAPRLVLRDVTVTAGEAGAIVRGTLEQVQAEEPFRLPVPVVVVGAAGPHETVVEMDGRQASFAIAVAGEPRALAVDPGFDLFRLLDPRETPATIGQLFGAPEILAVLPADDDGSWRALAEGWRSDDHAIEMASEAALERLPRDRSGWVLGRTNRFAAEIAGGEPSAAGATLALGEESVPVDERTVVVVRRNPGDPALAIGWISIEPPAAFPGLGRKLPHYGKYSYLAFEGEEPANVVKGSWEATDSPLVVALVSGGARALAPPSRTALAELPPVFSERELAAHVDWLAAPEREGRGLGSAGLDAAATYIAERFAAAGLEPAGDEGGFLQRFTVAKGPAGAPVETANVVGILRGSRADWDQQSIVLAAHYDHLGRGWPDVHAGDEGLVHPGADDNASGVAVLLELARLLAAEGGGLRNLVFVAFSGEESGLTGSRHYVAHPVRPLAGLRGVVNLDTVGRLGDGEIAVHATGTADEWPHIFRGVGFVTGIRSKNVPALVGGSDQDSFIAAGVPAVQIFTGAHADYHRPTDTADKVDAAGLVQVATFVKEALAYLLEREEPLTVRIEGAAPTPAAAPASGRPVSFGIVPAFAFAGPGVEVESVVPGSPAETAGVRAGDVLLAIDDRAIEDLRAFSNRLKELAPGTVVRARLRRGGEVLEVEVAVVAR